MGSNSRREGIGKPDKSVVYPQESRTTQSASTTRDKPHRYRKPFIQLSSNGISDQLLVSSNYDLNGNGGKDPFPNRVYDGILDELKHRSSVKHGSVAADISESPKVLKNTRKVKRSARKASGYSVEETLTNKTSPNYVFRIEIEGRDPKGLKLFKRFQNLQLQNKVTETSKGMFECDLINFLLRLTNSYTDRATPSSTEQSKLTRVLSRYGQSVHRRFLDVGSQSSLSSSSSPRAVGGSCSDRTLTSEVEDKRHYNSRKNPSKREEYSWKKYSLWDSPRSSQVEGSPRKKSGRCRQRKGRRKSKMFRAGPRDRLPGGRSCTHHEHPLWCCSHGHRHRIYCCNTRLPNPSPCLRRPLTTDSESRSDIDRHAYWDVLD